MVKKLKDVMSPGSWIAMLFAGFPAIYLLLRPSWFEFGILVAAYFVTLGPLAIVADRVIFALRPRYRNFYFGIDFDVVANMSKTDLTQLLEDIRDFPRFRSVHSLFGLLLVNSTNVVVAMLVFDYQQHQLIQFSEIISVILVGCAYQFAITLIENHKYCSQLIAEIHQHVDVSHCFPEPNKGDDRTTFFGLELIAVTVMWLFIIGLNANSIATHAGDTLNILVEVIYIDFTGLILLFRVWQVSNDYFKGGFLRIVDAVRNLEPAKPQQQLPPHTVGSLSYLDNAFNGLLLRIEQYEADLTQEMTRKSERERYEAMGEFAALIAHDLAGPLHVVNFCVQQLIRDPKILANDRYKEHLETNVATALDLVKSLRRSLTDSADEPDESSVKEVYMTMMRISTAMYRDQAAFGSIKFDIHGEIDYKVSISRTNLFHILSNIYSNSIKNIVENKLSDGVISLSCEASSDVVCICIADNGTGMTAAQFDAITSGQLGAHQPVRKGLGLRLIRRLVEKHEGSMEVKPQRLSDSKNATTGRPGTLIELVLPMASQRRPERERSGLQKNA